ncbi:MAG: GntR family transcriptional regulator [Actinomycetota bacterium]|nr:GntR family transcriptional regulator [Actinomycetota bacterium]
MHEHPASTGPPPPSTTTQHALDGLRNAITTRALRPGQRVGQDELAGQLGVSIAPIREALRILEQEGQVTYYPRRGYFVTQLDLADLSEIYALRALLETRTARQAIQAVDSQALERAASAATDCARAVEAGNVLAELEANRRFHFAILEPAAHPHTLRLIRQLWDLTEAYRALYYNQEQERRRTVAAHERILAALVAHDADLLVAELDEHRERALAVLAQILAPAA